MARILLPLVCIGQVIALSVAEPFCRRDMSGLKQVITLFRHGDRNADSTFPTDIYTNEDSWPTGWGSLLPKGMVRHNKFGKFMRNCYGSFLRDELKLNAVYVRATEVPRAIMSAQSHLSGAYPPKGIQVWGQNEKIALGRYWQPFPVYVTPVPMDQLILTQFMCPRFQELAKEAYTSSDRALEVSARDADILKFLAQKAGLNTSDLETVTAKMANAVLVEIEQSRKLVPWLNRTLTDRLAEYNDIYFELLYNTLPDQARLAVGRLLQGVIDNMLDRKNAVQGQKTKTNYEHVIYSAHDLTVAAMLSLLGDYNNKAPPYAAAVIFELHKNSQGTWGVVVSYRNSSTKDPVPVYVENCSGFMGWGCTLSDFLDATKDKASSDLTKDCKAMNTAPVTAPVTTKGTTARAPIRATSRAVTTRRTTTTTASPDEGDANDDDNGGEDNDWSN